MQACQTSSSDVGGQVSIGCLVRRRANGSSLLNYSGKQQQQRRAEPSAILCKTDFRCSLGLEGMRNELTLLRHLRLPGPGFAIFLAIEA